MGRAESFLARWSRRKRLAAARMREAPRSEATTEAPEAPPVSPEPAGDVAPRPLPPVESLEAGSDITPFLAPGVPAELTRQALRRAWMADPAIRDFTGLSENAWDFTAAGGVPGFGSLSVEDAARLLARALGTTGEAGAPQQEMKVCATSGETAAQRPASYRASQIAGRKETPQDFGEREINRPPPPRSHGGALPK
jgi:Protein of unknown function (DUF3306)